MVEAKEDSSCDLRKALVEIEGARKNRHASIGVLYSQSSPRLTARRLCFDTATTSLSSGNSEDLNSDVILRAALLLARALCVRQAKSRTAETVDFQTIDAAILVIETEAKRLAKMKGLVETIGSHSTKVLDEIRKMSDAMDRQIGLLRNAVEGLKGSSGTELSTSLAAS